MKQEIAAISPADVARLEGYFRDNREKLQRFTPILQTAFESWRDLARPEILRMLPLLRPWQSTRFGPSQVFPGRSDSTRLQLSVEVPGNVAIFLSQSVQHSFLSGIRAWCISSCGWLRLGHKAMARIAEGMGVRILRNMSVEEMLFEGRRAVAVRTGGEVGEIIKADAVVVNADFA